jgi:Ca2+-binding RTX toxin-like protein
VCTLFWLVATCLASAHESAAAGGVTCHGEPATIVGSPGSQVDGTDGPDVIVTQGAERTFAGAGADLVCVTGGADLVHLYVLAGDGNDVIDSTASAAQGLVVDLGPGDDTFTGGDMRDVVHASDSDASPRGQGADTVSTGGGADIVVTGDSYARPDHDTVDLGNGRDEAWVDGPFDASRPIQGGAGPDLVQLSRRALRRALVIDNATGVATAAGEPAMAWGAIERFRLGAIGSWEAPSFLGGPAAEYVWTSVPLTELDLGGGDDKVNLELQDQLVDDASYAGGDGHDTFILYAGHGDMARRVELDLPDAYLMFRRDQQHHVEANIDGFETHRLSARRLEVRGTKNGDHVQWAGCQGLIHTGRGADLVESFWMDDVGCGYLWESAHLVVRGGRGPDKLVGNDAPDILIGGAGNDYADGRRDRDHCVAETTVHCES